MKKLLILIAAVAALSSCGAYKRLAYLQDMVPEEAYPVTQTSDTRIMRGDKLGITVMSSQPILAAPFNVRPEVTVKDSSSVAKDAPDPVYIVDTKGRINFPVLGPIYVEGLTLNELSTLLVDEIRATNYLKDPVVSIFFSNFNVILLGEANTRNSFSFPEGNVSIFDLLAKASDITQDADREKLWVVRTAGGARKLFELNLKSKNVFDSPAYYLQQGDMVVVQPRNGKMDNSVQNVLTWISAPLALISTIFSGLAFVRTYSR